MQAFRLYHLILGLTAVGAFITAEELGLVHAWLGYAVAGLLIVRLVLGLARSRGFAFRRLIPSLAPPPLGQTGIHHPVISRLLALAILLSVTGTAVTGIMMDEGGTLVGKSIRAHDGEEVRRDSASLFGLISPARADEGSAGEESQDEDEGGLVGEIHETLGNLILPLVALHAAYLLLFRLPLARFILFADRRPV